MKKHKLLIALAFLVFLIFPTFSVSADSNIIQKGNAVPQDPTVPASYHEHAVQFKASDGVKLVGYVLGTGDKGVTLGHARGWSLKSLVPFANELVEQGYKVIIWDYRNNEPSDKAEEPAFFRIDLDVLAAVEVLKEEGVNQIFMIGASVGGTSTAVAASQTANLVGLGILSSPRNFGGEAVNALAAVQKITVPSFFAVSNHDFSGDYYSEVKGLYDASAAQNKVFHTIDSGEHGFDMLLAPDKYLDGIEKETPYKETKDPEPLKVLNQQLLDFVNQAFGKEKSTSNSSSSSSTSSSKKEITASSTDEKKNTQNTKESNNSLLLYVFIPVFLIILALIGFLVIKKRKK